MPYLELHLRLLAKDQPAVETALQDHGSLAITLLDAEDVPILEPGVGETPLWPDINLVALYDFTMDPLELLAQLDDLIPYDILRTAKFARVDDQDWTRVWMDGFKPMQFGKRLWIVPTNHQAPDPAAVNIILDPGLAFGSGTHPTTAMCLQFLDGVTLSQQTVMDFGCGSGILAIAALKLGAKLAYGVDNDPQALIASKENALRNGVARQLQLFSDRDPPAPPADVLVANILLPPLLALKDLLANAVRAGGKAAFSGMLAGQEAEFIPAYQAKFKDFDVQQTGDWICIHAVRRMPDA